MMFDIPESASALRGLDEICTLPRVDSRSKRLVDAEGPAN